MKEDGMSRINELLDIISECLDYPTALLPGRLDRVVSVSGARDVSRLLRPFMTFVEESPLEQVEELYTETFDLEPASCLYVGYHLFGDTHRRGIFMVKLAECYEACTISRGNELPDHLAVLLRFIDRTDNTAEAEEIVRYCIMPALDHIIAALKKGNAYLPVLEALKLLLEQRKGRQP